MHYYVSNAKRTSYATSLCVCVCAYLYFDFIEFRGNSLVRPVTSCFHLHLINTALNRRISTDDKHEKYSVVSWQIR